MTEVNLSLGSNVDPRQHVAAALDALQSEFGALEISRIYESEAVGFDGDNFLNLVVRAQTDLSLQDLADWLKRLEQDNGRRRSQAGFSSRTLDIDVLTYDDYQGHHAGMLLPRPEITKNAFVLWPLSEVDGQRRDPHSGMTYAQLWQAYDRQRQKLWPIDFHWQGRRISHAD